MWRDKISKWLELKPEIRYQLIELPALKTHTGWDKDSRETIATLMAHPGFVALLDYLDLQAGLLRSKLAQEHHADIRAVEFLQSGIFWCGWLRNQVKSATVKISQTRVEAENEDKEALQKLEAMLEKVE